MTHSDLHEVWLARRKAAKLRISHSIISDFIACYDDDIGPDGIRTEHNKLECALNGGGVESFSEESEIRYGETAYTIWALGHRLGRWDILEANISNWGHGEDGCGNSIFRNVEFESQVALRFLEEEHQVELLEGNHEAEMVVDNFFSIECKRQYDFRGILRNSIKARSQIENSDHKGILIINVDDLIDPSNEEEVETELGRVSTVAEYGFGDIDSDIVGVVVEYVDDTLNVAQEGSYVHTVHNCSDPDSGLCNRIIDRTIDGLTGSDNRDTRDPQIDLEDRYSGKYDKEKESDYIDFYHSQIKR